MCDLSWKSIKENIYYEDGSLRDIYILDASIDDWRNWISFVNQQYRVEFYNGQTQQTESEISKKVVFDYFEGKTDLISGATIWLDEISVQCHFFTDQEIENDINPKEIVSIETHNKVVKYLKEISVAVKKRAILTPENGQGLAFIIADQEKIVLNLK